VWSVAIYDCETCTLQKEEINRINALEMWIWCRMEKISWTEKRSNENVLGLVEETRSLVATINARKKN
jgi:hypothetical protein